MSCRHCLFGAPIPLLLSNCLGIKAEAEKGGGPGEEGLVGGEASQSVHGTTGRLSAGSPALGEGV